VGRVLAAQGAPTLKRLSLELGGNAPFIVFDDAAPASSARSLRQTAAPPAARWPP
jgi:succinate-semialdehyde dehydrogenase/glutarate-semialdehyde dehydrogenase